MPSVESFSPKLMATLLRGAAGGFTISMPYREAVRFRQRIYQLRKAMQETKHPKYTLVSRVKITIDWDKTLPISKTSRNVPFPIDRGAKVQVRIAPADSEFDDTLEAAGVTIDDIDLEDIGAEGPNKPDLAALLKDIKP